MVVEPDIIIRHTISEYLRDCGYKVIEGVSSDDVEAVLASRQRVDIIFADVQIGGSMNGFELTQWVRAHRPRIGVILTSGTQRACEGAAELCHNGPLNKPYEPQVVARRINLLLQHRRPPRPPATG